MTERPIIFSGQMIRAILDGRKTQTRRVVKPQPVHCADCYDHVAMWIWPPGCEPGEDGCSWGDKCEDGATRAMRLACPYGQPGDRLWVREKFVRHWNGTVHETIYAATIPSELEPFAFKWKPSIHMPHWASRITLEVVSIRVQRVQDISENDAIAEGVFGDETQQASTSPEQWADQAPPTMCFAALWNSINAARGFGWSMNPWVWCIEFKREVPE